MITYFLTMLVFICAVGWWIRKRRTRDEASWG